MKKQNKKSDQHALRIECHTQLNRFYCHIQSKYVLLVVR